MKRHTRLTLALALLGFVAAPSPAAADRADWSKLDRQPDAWYQGDEGRAAAGHVRANQTPNGDWPKNVDTTKARPSVPDRGTFDNSATTSEVRFLARAFRVNRDPADRVAVAKAIDLILKAQYPSGGWPQSYPPGPHYPRHVTFNDDTMVKVLVLLRDVAGSDDFAFLDAPRRASARRAFDAGIACILRCQVVVNGKKTVWCAQHDAVTLEPRPARTFEPVSLSGSESATVLDLLMSLDRPGPDVIAAVDSGAAWFGTAKLVGIRQEVVNGDKRIVPDPSAPPLWARFYEIGTNRPMFCGRDGVVKFSIAEIEPERRNGYGWYGQWGTRLAKRHAAWKSELGR